MDTKIKIIFFGTPDIAVECLTSLNEDDRFEVMAVVTQEDKPVGRKKIMTPPPVKVYAEEKNIPVYQPARLNDSEDLYERLSALGVDYNVVVAYGQIMSQKWLDVPSKRSVNLHVSLLPKYRGASPMQEALKHGDKMTGVTVQDMVFKMDQGDILAQEEFDIGDDDTLYEVYTRASNIGAALLPKVLHEDFLGNVTPIPQSIEGVSYCTKITKQDGFVDLEEDSAEEIYNKYRAYKMWPGVWTMAHGKRLKLTELAMESSQGLEPGRLQILRVQPEGKKEMGYEDYLRGV